MVAGVDLAAVEEHRVGEHLYTDPSGNRHTIATYRASHCDTCPLHPRCFKGRGDREVEVNHNLRRHKAYARELLTSEEGLLRRSRRPIEPEAVFGQMKYNKQYKRFRHFGKAKVHMDLGLFFIAFNIQKMMRGVLRFIINGLKRLHKSLLSDFADFSAFAPPLFQKPSRTPYRPP